MMKKPLYIIAGPTAAGKSALAVELAKKLDGEIISGDSMQVYRGMNIGTAKIRPEEMQGNSPSSDRLRGPMGRVECRAVYRAGTADGPKRIWKRGRIPIVAGGTGFSACRSIWSGIYVGDRRKLRREIGRDRGDRRRPGQELYRRLMEADPEAAERIHPNNVKRVIRALEFFLQTGHRISEHNDEQKQKESPYELHYNVLSMDRERLYERIDRRVDEMMRAGLVEEVQGLLRQGCERSMVSMQGLGYKEIIAYLAGETTLEEAVYILKRDTRHFAKRQLTWFRREEAHWILRGEEELDTLVGQVQ